MIGRTILVFDIFKYDNGSIHIFVKIHSMSMAQIDQRISSVISLNENLIRKRTDDTIRCPNLKGTDTCCCDESCDDVAEEFDDVDTSFARNMADIVVVSVD